MSAQVVSIYVASILTRPPALAPNVAINSASRLSLVCKGVISPSPRSDIINRPLNEVVPTEITTYSPTPSVTLAPESRKQSFLGFLPGSRLSRSAMQSS